MSSIEYGNYFPRQAARKFSGGKLYNAKDYTPSSTVRNYSNNIMEKYRQYRDENKAEKELKKLKNIKL